jgi:hypothetical protein
MTLTLVLLAGCGIVAGPSPADPTCAMLDEHHLIWTAVATAGGSIGTVAGAVVPMVDQWASDEDRGDWQLGLGITGAVGGALGILGTFMAGEVNQRWNAAGCGGE